MFGFEFYPTPKWLADKLLAKLNLANCHSVLEPSCGKGDFLSAFNEYRSLQKEYWYKRLHAPTPKLFCKLFNEKHGTDFSTINEIDQWLYDQNPKGDDYVICCDKSVAKQPVEITCVEIDSSLCGILKQTYSKVINANFLDWCDFSAYDTVLMNPPFLDGDKHLLKAIKLIERGGGQICCILNAETLRNPYCQSRRTLLDKLSEYHADVEYVQNAFAEAERKADVDVALIYLNIPRSTATDDIVKGLVSGDVYDECYEEISNTQLYAGNVISLMVEQFAKEARLGIELIHRFDELQPFLSTLNGTQEQLIKLEIVSSEQKGSRQNRFIRALREKYWTAAFQTNEIASLLTDDARDAYRQKIAMFRDYDFTLSNIKQLQLELSQHLSSNIHTAIVKMYDRFTYRHSMDNSSNVHMFSGWKTNDGFKINPKKVIVPLHLYSVYGSYCSWDLYKARDFCTELEKVLTYLDNGETDGRSAWEIISEHNGKAYNGEKIECKYFDIEPKKKGTLHVYWKCEPLIKKLTIIGCKEHGSLPNDYGEREYSSLSKDEQAVADSFEGKSGYADTRQNVKFYCGETGIKLLTTG